MASSELGALVDSELNTLSIDTQEKVRTFSRVSRSKWKHEDRARCN